MFILLFFTISHWLIFRCNTLPNTKSLYEVFIQEENEEENEEEEIVFLRLLLKQKKNTHTHILARKNSPTMGIGKKYIF